MPTFNVYRNTKSRERANPSFRANPTKVASIEAENAEFAAVEFRKSLYRKTGVNWNDGIIETRRKRNGQAITADLWMRRFTTSGRYQGETHFMIWPKPEPS